MLKIPVLVSDITHLTDARYFAAWGVDYLAYSIESGSDTFMSSNQIAAISEWVEGPEVLGATQGVSEIGEDLAEYEPLLAGYLLGIYTPKHILETFENKKCVHEILVDQQGVNEIDLKEILVITPYIVLKSNKSYKETSDIAAGLGLDPMTTFIDTILTVAELSDPTYGVVLRGAKEEKVGVKSYDDIDDIMDVLMD